jgi:hypothetical protein
MITMTPKEKAEQLINKFKDPVRWKMGQEDVLDRAKQCSLIAVDEVIDILSILPYGMQYLSHIDYWERVKQELL